MTKYFNKVFESKNFLKFENINMDLTEETEFQVLQTLLSSNEIAEISNGVCKKLEVFFKNKFDEFITAKAVFEINRKNLGSMTNCFTNM
jgi:hypothetical protein